MTAHATGADVLAAVVSAFATAGVELPGRRYVTSGQVAVDCEQVVVSVDRIFPGVPGVEAVAEDLPGCRGPRVQSMEVAIARCVPLPDDEDGTPPDADELDASAAELLRDLDILHDGLIEHLNANKADWSDRRQWRVGACDSYGPEGGYGGWRVRVEVAV